MGLIPQLIETITKTEQAAVLAQVIHVEGTAYRKEGAWMCFLEDGSTIGILSGGCLESDLQIRAKELYHSGEVKQCKFDLSAEDDLGWGRGAGCNGVVTVLLRDVDDEFKECLHFLHDELQQKRPVKFIQSLEDEYKYQFSSASHKVGPLQIEQVHESLQPYQQVAEQKWMEDELFYHQWIWPEPSLYLFGAGADARPFAQLASTVGYAVHICDWREALCTKVNFPTATSFKIGPIDKLLRQINFHSLDSVVIMTHDFQVDEQIVRRLQDTQLLYTGLLGSKKRTMRLVGNSIPAWLNSPIGLSIGAVGPEEIAVSIIAEMISIRRGMAICPSLASI